MSDGWGAHTFGNIVYLQHIFAVAEFADYILSSNEITEITFFFLLKSILI